MELVYEAASSTAQQDLRAIRNVVHKISVAIRFFNDYPRAFELMGGSSCLPAACADAANCFVVWLSSFLLLSRSAYIGHHIDRNRFADRRSYIIYIDVYLFVYTYMCIYTPLTDYLLCVYI